MTKYNRITGKVFGGNATATGDDPEIGQFGSAKDGSFVGTTDVATIQSLPAWSKGWIEAVSPEDNFPPLPEMTGAMKVLSHQQCYLLQQGLAEWDNSTIYYTNNFASKNGRIYISQTNENQGNDPSTDTTNWKEFASGGLPIGTIYPVACTAGYVPDGALPCNGTEYTKAQFTELWNNFLTATTPLLNTCTYTEYASDISTYGKCGKWGLDSASGKFKVPTIPDGTHIQQAMTDNELGKSYNAGLPDFTGLINYQVQDTLASGSTHIYTKIVTQKASDINQIYQDINTVQTEAVALRYFVQVANGQINQSQMDWSAWATGLQSKVDVSNTQWATNACMPDYSATIIVSSLPYTAPADGQFCWLAGINSYCSIEINGVDVTRTGELEVARGISNYTNTATILISKGDIISKHAGSFARAYFFPMKGAN